MLSMVSELCYCPYILHTVESRCRCLSTKVSTLSPLAFQLHVTQSSWLMCTSKQGTKQTLEPDLVRTQRQSVPCLCNQKEQCTTQCLVVGGQRDNASPLLFRNYSVAALIGVIVPKGSDYEQRVAPGVITSSRSYSTGSRCLVRRNGQRV